MIDFSGLKTVFSETPWERLPMWGETLSIHWRSFLNDGMGESSDLPGINEMDSAWTGREDLWPPKQDHTCPVGAASSINNDEPVPACVQRRSQSQSGEDVDGDCSDPNVDKKARYELRETGCDISRYRTWLDQDKTGDFDPEEEVKQQRLHLLASLRRKRLGRSRQHRSLDSDNSPRGCDDFSKSETAPPVLAKGHQVVLKVASEDGKSLIRKYANELRKIITAKHDGLSDGYRLRRRPHKGKVELCVQSRIDIDDIPADLTGWPEARGCVSCLLLGEHCPLLDDETRYPCSRCTECDGDCELVKPPRLKRTCESCRRSRKNCSFSYTVEHGDFCTQCAEQSWHCVAGPSIDAIRRRIRYPDETGCNLVEKSFKKLPKPKLIVTCRKCQDAGRECSFNHDWAGDVCIACDMSNSPCQKLTSGPLPSSHEQQNQCQVRQTIRKRRNADIVEPVGSEDEIFINLGPDVMHLERRKRKKKVNNTIRPPDQARPSMSSNPNDSESNLFNPIISTQSSPDSVGTQKVVRTAFSHPMKFNHQTSIAAGRAKPEPCHFCAEPIIAAFGFGERSVDVIEWHDGSGYTELQGGHHCDGIEGTRLCVYCTSRRLDIIKCPKHKMEGIRGQDSLSSTEEQWPEAFGRLNDNRIRDTDFWCSVCIRLAGYRCCAPGTSSDSRESVKHGCGLHLCDECNSLLEQTYRGDLDGMLGDERRGGCGQDGLGLRADAELLKQRGLLMNHVRHLTEGSLI